MNIRNMLQAAGSDGIETAMLESVFDEGGIEILTQLAESEAKIMADANELSEAYADTPVSIPEPDPTERAEQLKRGMFALAKGEFPAFMAQEWVNSFDGADDPDSIAEYANLSPEEWEAKQDAIVQSYRDRGITEVEADQIMATYIRTMYGVDIAAFESFVVEWDGDKKKDWLAKFLGGQEPDPSEPLMFVGFDTAHAVFAGLKPEA